MTGFKILEFNKSQYSYAVIEKALSAKVSEGWKVVSMHTDVSTDPKGTVVVLLQQIVPGEEETMSYEELYKKKQAELEIKRIQSEIDHQDSISAFYSTEMNHDVLGETAYMRAMRMTGVSGYGAINGFMGHSNFDGLFNDSDNWICSCGKIDNKGKFCGNCGQARPVSSGWTCSCGQTGNTGNFCDNCGKPLT